MSLFALIKLVHILSAAVLFGTGAGIAFFMLQAHRTGRAEVVAATARIVVLADFLFTAPAVILQPFSGVALAAIQGYRLFEPWLVWAWALYLLIGACWLPVVVIQLRIRRLAEAAVAQGAPLPAAYHRLFRVWFILGWPAFAGVVAVYGLMITRPVL
ncbi:MAG: DUF2269 domain-containing protein [Caulobacter sp.]|nr:DUF2269 domain-containing protein [Caulobacter sp.]